MLDVPYLVDCILSLPYSQKEDSITGRKVIDTLLSLGYTKTAEFVRAFIARDPYITTSIKMLPLCTMLNDAALAGDTIPADVIEECQKQRAFLLDSATQPMSPPAPPRPPSEDKRDFDRPNAPPRPRPDDQRGSPEGMSANEYQRLAKRTEALVDVFGVDRNSLHDPGPVDYRISRLLHAAIGCGTEAGELLDGMKKNMWYKKKLDLVNVVEEFGDLLWYIAIGLDALGCTMEDAMHRNINKLKTRYPEKFNAEQAVNRDLDAERSQLEKDALASVGSDLNPEEFKNLYQELGITEEEIKAQPRHFKPSLAPRECIAHRVDAETGTTYEVHHGAPASAAESIDPIVKGQGS